MPRCSRLQRPLGTVAVGSIVLSAILYGNAASARAEPLTVGWPPSTALLVSEVVTGGASASDEFAELYNAGPGPVDLAGLELVYVSATGGTVTRKASWPDALVLAPGAHLLAANAAGVHAVMADATYTGGLSATGGVLVLRSLDGSVVDSLSWGEAANGFVEGSPGPAPAAGSSLERLPGGSAGNGIDNNDNLADTHVEPAPVAQGSLAEPIPWPGPTPGPTYGPTPEPSPAPTPEPTAAPTAEPTSLPTLAPTPEPTPEPTSPPPPSSAPSVPPTPTAAATTAPPSPSPSLTPSPSPSLTPSPSPSPTPAVLTIAAARDLPVGSTASVEGIVTAELGGILDERTFVVQDSTGGLPVRWNGPTSTLALGELVRVEGQLADPYGNLELRLPGDGPPVKLGSGSILTALRVPTGSLGEATEGMLVRLKGTVVAATRSSSGSAAIDIDDGSGLARVAVAKTIDLDPLPHKGERLIVIGIGGQRASARGRADGYRVWPRRAADLTLLPAKGASPSASPGPSQTPEHGSPAPGSPGPISIAQALERPGQSVTIRGVITSPPRLFDSDGRRVTVQDASGALLVRLPTDQGTVARSRRMRVSGTMGSYYGAPQVDASEGAVDDLGSATPPPPTVVTSAPLPAGLEWRLVRASGRVDALHRDGEAWRAELVLASGGRLPVVGSARAGIPATALPEGRTATITGLVKRPYPTATDRRFAIMPRDAADIDLLGSPSSGPGPAGGPGVGHGPGGKVPTGEKGAGFTGGSVALATETPLDVRLADLAAHDGELVRVGGRLVERRGRLIQLQDESGRASARLPRDGVPSEPRAGELLNVIGRVERLGQGWVVAARGPSDLQRLGRLASAGPQAGPPIAGGAAITPGPGAAEEPAEALSPPQRPPSLGLALGLLLALGALGTGLIGAMAHRRGTRLQTPQAIRSVLGIPGRNPE